MTERVVILVEQDRWVVVGSNPVRSGDHIRLSRTAVIRRWGAAREGGGGGLGLLARKGPQPGTTLDYEGDTERHVLCVVRQIECNPSVWQDHLRAP